jgi:hypothetical protein
VNGRNAPNSRRILRIEDMPDGSRVSIVESEGGDWMRITVRPVPRRRFGYEREEGIFIEHGVYNAAADVFIEWTEFNGDRTSALMDAHRAQ